MRYFFSVRALVAAVLILTGGGAVHADQKDGRLDALFGQLQQSITPDEAADITSRIWQVWTEIDDPAVAAEMAQGIDALAAGNLPVALVLFNDVVQKYPDFAEGWNKRATVNYMMGYLDQSLKDVAVTLGLEPRHFGALEGAGLIFMARGDRAKAIDAFERALEANPYLPFTQARIDMLKDELKKSAI